MTKYHDKVTTARGAGGGGDSKSGGGAGRAPIEAPDSLRSRQNARVLDLICEGEIEGLVDGLKSVYLDETPIQNPDGTYNFKGVNFLMRNGTQNQAFVPGFGAIESEKPVGSEVTAAAPVTRSLTNPNLDAARVTISVPQLTLQNTETGDLNGTSVTIAIDVQNNGGGFIAQALRKIYTAANFALVSSTQARCYVASTLYQIAVQWTGQQVYAPQTCTMQLQYRVVGAPSWSIYETYTFSGGSYSTSTAFGVPIGGTYPSGSRTFAISLPSATYEFRLVKTSGSIQNPPTTVFGQTIQQPPSVGTAYGGAVAITGGTIYQPVASDVITGKTTKRYQRDYRIELPSPGPWDIRVRRLTADSAQTVLQNKTFWDSYTEIIDTKLSYPNSVVAGMQITADQFRAIPSRGYLIRGLKVRIPSNYDPLQRTYDGAWDGTFVTAWSNNPAWCFYDLITSERYGLGGFIDEDQVDKWALYTIAQYCDEMVEDGYGGIEPRFTLNMYIQAREDAFSVINSMASIFRAMAYWSAGSVTAVQDAPTDPVALFTAANVIDGAFNYSGSSSKSRHTVVLVAWNDPLDGFRQKIEYVEDTDGIDRYGYVQTQVYALGCTSRGQAHRYGRAIIYSEQMESETISFGCGLDGVVCYPGAIINVQDQFRSGVRLGGRVISADASNVTIDNSVTLESGKVYTLSCVLPDATVEDRTITNAAGTHSVLTLDTPFSNAPQEMAIWMVTTPTLQATSWRIVSIAETSKGRLDITALAYRPDKYAAIDEGLILEPINYTNIGANPDPASNLTVTETLTLVALGVVGVKATVSWDMVSTAVSYIVRYQRENQNISELTATTNSIDISPLEEGTYTFSVIAVNALGRRSQESEIDVTIYGKTLPPADVDNFQLAAIGGNAHITYTPSTDLDVSVGGYLRVKHSPLTTLADWSAAVDIGPSIPGDSSSAVLPLVSGTYLAKWVDSSGNESESPVSIYTNAPTLIDFNAVETVTEHPTWPGTKTDVMYDPDLEGIKLVSSEDWDSDELIDSEEFVDAGDVIGSGEYLSATTIDLGAVMTSRLTATLLAEAFSVSDLIDSDEDWDSTEFVDVTTGSTGLAQIYVRTTDDDPGGSPVWGAWEPFFMGDWAARAFQFKVILSSGDVSDNVLVKEMSVTVDMPDRMEAGNNIFSGAGAKTVTYTIPFKAKKARTITAENLQQGDYWVISNESTAGFDITFRNLSGVAVSRTFDYATVGYGNG
jgi:predicted phage tail protein